MTDTSHSLNHLDLESFSFRWDNGLEDEDESVSDYGTVLHTGETNLSAPLTTTTGLSAVEEITEGVLTDSRATSSARRLSPNIPPSNNELASFPSHNYKHLEVAKDNRNLLRRLLSASGGLVPRLFTSWSVPVPTPLVVNVQTDYSGKPPKTPHRRPRNKLRKKTRPSIAITLVVEPTSSFSLARPLPRTLEALRTGANPASVSPVAAFSSAKSFLSFQLPPVFSRARSKVLQKSTRRPSNDVAVVNRISTADRPQVDTFGIRTRKSGARVSWDNQPAVDSERIRSIHENGIGNFPTPIGSAGHRGRIGGTGEGTSPRGPSSRTSTSWELGLGLGQDIRLRACGFWRGRGG